MRVSSTNTLIDNFIMKVNSKEEDIIVASEIAQIYRAFRHNHSYNSLDCSLKLNSKLYQDSKVAAKTSCGRTKSEAIVSNVLAKKVLEVVLNDFNHQTSIFLPSNCCFKSQKHKNAFSLCSVF